jgi:hypothetical protein
MGIVDIVVKENKGGCWDYDERPFFSLKGLLPRKNILNIAYLKYLLVPLLKRWIKELQ